MIWATSKLLLLAATLLPAMASKIAWDGRIPKGYKPSDFDSAAKSPYNVDWNKGENQSWSDIVTFPRVGKAPNDGPNHKPFQVNINDESIFAPGGNYQYGFRRSELMPAPNNGSDALVRNTVTLHISLLIPHAHALNSSHETSVLFLETADFLANTFSLKTGVPINPVRGDKSPRRSLRLEGTTLGGKPRGDLLWQKEITYGQWMQLEITVDFEKGWLGLVDAGAKGKKGWPRANGGKWKNDASGRGQWHIGVFKYPVGEKDDVVHKGYQPSGLHEGVVFGGVFMTK